MNLGVTKTMANARNSMSEGAFQQAGSALSAAKNIVREEMQKETSSRIEETINKLQSNRQIAAEEIALIKAWIVGDAEGYIKMENNFQDWGNEYERLEKLLKNYENKVCTAEDLLKLHGTLEDAVRVNHDIINFLEKQDRIKKFESAIADGLDKNERDTLVKVLMRKLQSPDY
ncbi:MAG: hypothetical protein ACE5KZ_04165 [Candidatus Scalinduaceae bacterium]